MKKVLEQEKWLPVNEFEGSYEISSLGRVKSLERKVKQAVKGMKPIKEKILKQHVSNKGYYYITLHKDGNKSRKLVHRLVAEAFIPNPENKSEVNHKGKHSKLDNSINNLEWVTPSENMEHSYHVLGNRTDTSKAVKANEKPVLATSIKTGETFKFTSIAEAIRKGYAYGKSNVSDAIKGVRQQTHNGFTWNYLSKHY